MLAGVSVALVSGRTTPVHGRARYAASVRLVVRAVLIGALGLLLGLVPSGIAVILAYYGVLFLLALPFLGLRARSLAALAVVWVLVVARGLAWLRAVTCPSTWSAALTPDSLLTPHLLLNELLLVGYYPAAVWLAYLLAGMAMGRLDLRRRFVGVQVLAGGVVLAVVATLVSRTLLDRPDAAAALAGDLPRPLGGRGPGRPAGRPHARPARHDPHRVVVVARHGRPALRHAAGPRGDDRQRDGGARTLPPADPGRSPGSGRRPSARVR